MKPFIDEGIISTTLDNGQVVLSDPSVLKLNCKFTIKDLEVIQNPPNPILPDFSSCPYFDLQTPARLITLYKDKICPKFATFLLFLSEKSYLQKCQ